MGFGSIVAAIPAPLASPYFIYDLFLDPPVLPLLRLSVMRLGVTLWWLTAPPDGAAGVAAALGTISDNFASSSRPVRCREVPGTFSYTSHRFPPLSSLTGLIRMVLQHTCLPCVCEN
jgi:hypothetical protein